MTVCHVADFYQDASKYIVHKGRIPDKALKLKKK